MGTMGMRPNASPPRTRKTGYGTPRRLESITSQATAASSPRTQSSRCPVIAPSRRNYVSSEEKPSSGDCQPILESCITPCGRRISQSCQHFLLVDAEEGFLFGAYLLHVGLVVAGVHCLPDVLHVALGIGPADHGFGDHLLGDKRGGLLEVLRRRQLLGQFPWPPCAPSIAR